MKKIYLVGLAFALLTASCDDVLEKTSSTQLPTIDAISSVADLTNAVNGVYVSVGMVLPAWEPIIAGRISGPYLAHGASVARISLKTMNCSLI